MIDGFELDPAWPHMTLAEVDAALTAPGARFEMETVAIRGLPTRVWKNAPPSLPMLARFSRLHGDRLITIFEEDRVSFEANFRASAALAAELRRRGIAKGDRVALAMMNLPEWPACFFAITALGAIAVPLNAWWTGPELAYGLADSGARALLCDRGRHERIAPHLPDLPDLAHVIVSRAESGDRLEDLIGAPGSWKELPAIDYPEAEVLPDDPAAIFYTSGTTGQPKGALGSHRNLTTNILSSGYTQARAVLRRGDQPAPPTPKIGLLVIPLFHVTACSASLMGSMVAGNTSIFMRKWDTVAAMEIIQRERVQVTGGVPTIAWQILEHPDRAKYDLSSLELITYGGAPSAPELAKRIYREFGALPGNGWGMTETMATVTAHVGEDYLNRPDSAGPPVPVADLKIVAADGATELPTGEVGELWARGPQIVIGYWNKPEATAETFVDGWVRTGDLARLDEEGFLTLVDRAKDVIIRGGENIYSTKVENVLYQYPGMMDAALIGIPHHSLGEEPAAIVHLAPGASATEEQLKAWVKDRLAIFKTPVKIVFLDQPLPRNANGKILKKDLKALFA